MELETFKKELLRYEIIEENLTDEQCIQKLKEIDQSNSEYYWEILDSKLWEEKVLSFLFKYSLALSINIDSSDNESIIVKKDIIKNFVSDSGKLYNERKVKKL
jgi:hypothetical protein